MGIEQRTVIRIFAIRISMAVGMACVGPVVFPFWKSHGLSMGEVFWLKFALLSTILVFELPSGVIADLIGRRRSLLVAGVLMAAAEGVYVCGTGFWAFLTAEVLIALGVAMATGTDQAVLYESLSRQNRAEEFGSLFGRLRAIELLASAGVAYWTGHIMMWWSRAPFAVAMFCFSGFTLLSWGLLVPRIEAGDGVAVSATEVVRRFPWHRRVLALVGFAALGFGVGPILKTYSQAFLASHNVSVGEFGHAPAAGLLAGVAVGIFAHTVIRHLGERAALMTIAATFTAAFAAFAFGTATIGQVAIAVFMANEVFTTIVVSKLVHAEVSDAVRATAMSVVGMGSRLCSLGLLLFFRKDSTDLTFAFTASGVVTASLFAGFILLRFAGKSPGPSRYMPPA